MKTATSLMTTSARRSRYEVNTNAIIPSLMLLILAVLSSAALAADGKSPAKPPASAPQFETTVLPILKAKCLRCHGPKIQKAELDLSSAAGIFRGGESGTIVEAGKPEESLLYEMLHDELMPPEGEGERLSKAEIAIIHRWITTGPKSDKTSPANSTTLNQHDVLPILRLRCVSCHNQKRREGGLSLESKATILKGGKSGAAIVIGKPQESLLIKKVRAGEMPPKKRLREASVKPITVEETSQLASWIAAGAHEVLVEPDVATRGQSDPLVSDGDRQFWSFQPPREAVPPQVRKRKLVRNPIDAFVLRRLEEQKLSPSDSADRLTLLRRASFDLTGLPPEPDEVKTFLADESDDAYERLIGRLLDSPRYGKRWSRYWLDLAGYADSEGKQGDPIRPYAWRYRDYVIRSLNEDKPYDRFLLEQIAGDELADWRNTKNLSQEVMDNLVATGFLRMAPDATGDPPANFIEDRVAVIADELDILGSAVMGLTLKCARCHTHKFDPIPHRDYYRLVAIFKGAYDEYNWQPSFLTRKKDAVPGEAHRLLSMVTPQEQRDTESHNAAIQKQMARLQHELDDKTEAQKAKHIKERLARLPKESREEVRRMLATPPNKRDAVLQYLADKFEASLQFDTKKLMKLDAGFKTEVDATTRRIALIEEQKWYPPAIRALWDRGRPSLTYVYRRGEHTNFGRLVGPGVPSMLTDGKTPFDVKQPWPGAGGGGRFDSGSQFWTESQ